MAANEKRLAEDLQQGLGALGLDLPTQTRQRLLDYLALLQRWGRVYNLTAVRDPGDMVTQHLLDCLTVVPFLPRRGRLIDVGSGAGLPAVPLALALPELQVTALDSAGKKARFIDQVRLSLPVPNLEVVHARVEKFRPGSDYDLVISRALAELRGFLDLTSHLLRPQGRWLAMKGPKVDAELATLPAGYRVLACHSLRVPGLEVERRLVEVGRAE